MMYYSLMFLLAAIVAGVLGFTGVAGISTWITETLFIVSLAMFLVLQVAYNYEHL